MVTDLKVLNNCVIGRESLYNITSYILQMQNKKLANKPPPECKCKKQNPNENQAQICLYFIFYILKRRTFIMYISAKIYKICTHSLPLEETSKVLRAFNQNQKA